MKLAEIEICTDGGPWAKHNYPCSVCGKYHAVLDLNTGVFQPCWACQTLGWKITKKSMRFSKFLRFLQPFRYN